MYNLICYCLILIGLLGTFGSVVFLKRKHMFDEKAYTYGIFAAIVFMMCSLFLVGSYSISFMILDGIVMACIFYNLTNVFGFRFGKIIEDETNNKVNSFFTSYAVVYGFINLGLMGIGGLLMTMYASNPDLIEMLGSDFTKSLLSAYELTIMNLLYVLICSIVSGCIIKYYAIKMFVHSARNKTFKTIMKALLLLFSYQLVSTFSPSNMREGILSVVLYCSITLAGYFIYSNSKNDKPSIQVVIK